MGEQKQLARLDALLAGRPDPTTADEKGGKSSGGGRFGDWEENQLVEMAAMDAVRNYYEADGWDVEDVSTRKCGWDLTCTRRRQVAKVEVKGVRGDGPTVMLTANELDAARNHKGWVLAVVTQALDTAEVAEFTAQQARVAARPYAFKADLTAVSGAGGRSPR